METRARRRARALGALLIALTLLAACGGGAQPATSGAPVEVMTITTIDSQGPTDPVIGVAAQTYERYLNDRGGINGHPLHVTVCDDHGTVAAATACAQQAVATKVVAVVGSFTFYGAAVLPVLASAGIAWFGICCAVSAPELASPVSFPIGSAFGVVGEIVRAGQDGCRKISAVVVDGTQAYLPVIDNALRSIGRSLAAPPQVLPATGRDYTTQLAAATANGTDCVVTIVNESLFPAFLTGFTAAHSTARIYGLQGELDATSVRGFEAATDNAVIAGSYADISTAPFADFRDALARYGAPKDAGDGGPYNYNSQGGLGTWTAYSGFTRVANAVPGELSAASFLAAASATTSLKLDGKAPDVDLAASWTDGLPGFTRVVNRTVIFQKISQGRVTPLTSTFLDLTPAVLGKPLPAP